MNYDITQRIQSAIGSFSKGQKRIAAVILENYDKAAYMTASRLGELANVSESTVVRFAGQLGYDGYPELQRAVQELVRIKLTPNQRIAVTNQRIGDFFNSFGVTGSNLGNGKQWIGKVGAVRVKHEEYNGNMSAKVAYCINRKNQDKLPPAKFSGSAVTPAPMAPINAEELPF